MDHRLPIVEAELKEQSDKVSKYILTTSVGTKYAWTYSSEYHPSWKEKCFEEGFQRIKEADTILLDWIKNREGSPASISWNCYGYALLNIQLKNIYNTNPEYNNTTSGINSLETDDNEKWVIDKNCPFMDDVLLKLFTKVRLRFDKGSLNKSSIEKDIFEKIGEHIDLNDAIWEICGSTIWKVENKKNNYSIKLIHNKSYSMNYIYKDNIIVD
jgi:hypothetical protein